MPHLCVLIHVTRELSEVMIKGWSYGLEGWSHDKEVESQYKLSHGYRIMDY